MNHNVLVTGGAGYIGSATCRKLFENGYYPIVLDNLSTGFRDLVKWGPIEVGELTDTNFVRQVIRKYKIDSIIHFAASAYVSESIADPIKYYKNNITSLISLLEACDEEKVTSFVFSSSCATYGNPMSEFIKEDHPQNPINSYGQTKLIGEQLLSDYSKRREFNYISLRYFNACGTESSLTVGEKHDPESHLIPRILDAIFLNNPITIFGNDYPTPDGTAVRDYVHVEDLADAHVLALQKIKQIPKSVAINLGTGTGISILQLISAFETKGFIVPRYFGKSRPGDPARLVADATRANSYLGWLPSKSNLDSIIQSAMAWRDKN